MSALSDHIEALRRDPTSAAAATAVRERALEVGALDRYAQAFAERGARLAEVDQREAVESLVEAAQIFEEELNDLERAAALYEAAIELEPGHRRSLFALGLLLHDLGRFEDLIALHRGRLARSTDDGEKTTLHLYISELLAEKLDSADAAFEEVMSAARLTPQNIRIISRLERLGERTDRLDEVAVVIGDLILHQEDPRVRAALSLRLAELQIGPLDDPVRALACFRSALVDDGASPEILAELRDVFKERARFDELAGLLEDASRDRRVGTQRIRLERELAALYEHELGDVKRALSTIAQAAKSSPDDRELLDEVMRLGLVAGDMETVAGVFEAAVDETQNALLRTYTLLKLGHLHGSVLDRPVDAVRVYERILSDDPAHAEARRRLHGLYERLGNLKGLAASMAEDAARLEDPAAQRSAYEALAAFYRDRLDDPKRAEDALRRIHEELRADVDASEHVSSGGQGESFEEALESLPPSAVMAEHSEDATETETDLAMLIAPEPADPADDPDRMDAPAQDEPLVAGVASEEIRAPADDEPLGLATTEHGALDDVAADEQSAPALDAEGLIDSATVDESATAGLSPDGCLDEAATQEETAPALDAAGLIADESLDEAAAEEESTPALEAAGLIADEAAAEEVSAPALDAADLIAEEVAASQQPAPDAAPIAEEPAASEVSAPALDAPAPIDDDIAQTLPVFEGLIDDDAIDEGAAMEQSAPALDAEGLVASAEPVPPSLKLVAAQTEDKIVALQQQLQEAKRAGDRDTQIELLSEIVQVNDSIDSYERGFFASIQLVRLEATTERVRELIRHGSLARAHMTLVDTYDEIAPRLDLEARLSFGTAIADIEAEDLLDADAAASRLEALHELVPDRRDVFERWTELLESEAQFDALVDVLDIEARRISGEQRARDLSIQSARIRELGLEDPSGAADSLIQHLERAPDDEVVRGETIRLLESSERWLDVTKLLEASLYQKEVAERVVLRRRIAAVHAQCLADVGAAEQMLRRALQESPEDQDTVLELCSIYEHASRWTDLIDVLTDQVAVLKGPKARGAVRRRIAKIAETELAQPELAQQHLENAVRDDPGDLESIEDLARLRAEAEDWPAMTDALVLKSRALTEPTDRAATLVEVAQTREVRLADTAGAAQAYRDALAIAPQHEAALDGYAALAERTGDYSGAIDALRDLASELDRSRAAQVHARVGRILELNLGQVEDAAFEYQLALDADPECIDALEPLRHHHEERGDPAHALELCARQAGLTEDPRRRAMLWGIAAELAQHRVEDVQRAIECYEHALDADPDDLATEATLGELFMGEAEYERAHSHLVRAAKGLSESDRPRAVRLMIAAGRAAEELDLNDEARAAYESALELDPREQLPLDRLGDLFEQAGLHERAHEVSAALILNHEGDLAPHESARVYLRMTRAKHRLGELRNALRHVEKARELQPQSPDVLELASQLLEEDDALVPAAETAAELAGRLADEDPAQLRAALSRAADLYQRAGEDSQALPLMVRLCDLEPRDQLLAERLADCRTRLGDSAGAASGLARTARLLEGRPKADLLARAAALVPGGLRSRDSAKAFLTEAIDVAPTHRQGLHELSIMLEFDEQWQALADLWERAAGAFLDDPFSVHDADDEARALAAARLLDDAFELHRFRLKDPQGTLRVARARHGLAPDDLAVLTDVARSLDAAAAAADDDDQGRRELLTEAAGAWATIVEARPGSLEALRRLFSIRQELGDRRSARIVAELLVALDAAQDEERRAAGLGEADRTDEMAAPLEAPTATAVTVEAHPSEASPLLDIVASMHPSALTVFTDAMDLPKLKKRDRVELSSIGVHLGRALEAAAAILGVPLPPLYASERARDAVVPGFVERAPALIVSPTLAANETSAGLRFYVGRALGLLRPPALTLALVPVEPLRAGLEGLAGDRIDAEFRFSELKPAKKRGRALEKALAPADRESIAEAVAQWLGSQGRETLLDQQQAVLRTAERWGLVASGSVLAAVDALARSGRRDRRWFVPLIGFAASRFFAETVGGDDR